MKIGIQGGPGSFHEQAAREMFGVEAELFYGATFAELYSELFEGEVDLALTGVANNRYGSLAEPMAAVLTGKYCIVGETYVRVEHQLLGVRGSRLSDIKEVHSQVMALGQCNDFLQGPALQKHVVRVEEDDTAGSARMVAEWSDPSKAAIASRRAGELYGLEVIAENIQDDPDNLTRFLVLQRPSDFAPKTTDNKSTMLLTTGQAPGSLVNALQPFKEYGVNIENLHSTFVPNTPFEIEFYMEVVAGLLDDRMKKILAVLESQGCVVKQLGSYDRADIPTAGGDIV